MEAFQNYAYYYNAFYQDKNYLSEAKQVDLILKRYGKNVKKIIDYGCGTGRHDIELSKLGYYCTGIDISPLMISMAKKNNSEIEFLVADIRDYNSLEKYDAVISLFHVMSYQNNNKDILASFRSARKAVDKEAIFLFDVWYGPGVLSDRPSIRVKEVQDNKYKMIRIARPVMHDKTNSVDVCYEILVIDSKLNIIKTINEVHTMRYFFRPELEYYLEQSGFILLDNIDGVTFGKTDFNSWTSYFVAKAV